MTKLVLDCSENATTSAGMHQCTELQRMGVQPAAIIRRAFVPDKHLSSYYFPCGVFIFKSVCKY